MKENYFLEILRKGKILRIFLFLELKCLSSKIVLILIFVDLERINLLYLLEEVF